MEDFSTGANRTAFFTIDVRKDGSMAERLRIDSSGVVRVGSTATYNASDKLTLVNSGNCSLTIDATSSTESSVFFADGATGTEAYRGYLQYKHSVDALVIGSSATERIRVHGWGDVNIAQKLNVVGVVTAASFESTTFSKTPTNTPAFHAWSNNVTTHSLSDSTWTKVEFLNSETLDTDSAYDNSTSGTTANRFTVPSGKGGYYQVNAGLNFYANANDIRGIIARIQVSGATKITQYGYIAGSADGDTRHFQVNLGGILSLAAGEYIELFGWLDTNGNSQGYWSNDANGYRGNFFSAYKLII